MNDLDKFVRLYVPGARAFAATVGITIDQLRNLRSGRCVPTRKHMEAIYRATGGMVAPNSFYDLTFPGEPNPK